MKQLFGIKIILRFKNYNRRQLTIQKANNLNTSSLTPLSKNILGI